MIFSLTLSPSLVLTVLSVRNHAALFSCSSDVSRVFFQLSANEAPFSRALQPSRKAPSRPPPPPSDPPPLNQPQVRPLVKVLRQNSAGNPQPNVNNLRKQLEDQMANQRRISKDHQDTYDFLKTPDGGKAHAVRQSIAGEAFKYLVLDW